MPLPGTRIYSVLVAGEAERERQQRHVTVSTGVKPDKVANAHLNHLGPQSARPLPRWFLWSTKWSRWRSFDKKDKPDMPSNNALEKASKKSGGMKVGKVSGTSLEVLKWDYATYSGDIKKGPDVFKFERLHQSDAAALQVDHLVYDNSGAKTGILKGLPHVEQAFREMMVNEVNYAKTHVFFYHSFGAIGIVYDVGATLMRVAFPEYAANADTQYAVLPRTDRSRFNKKSVASVKQHFGEWFNSDTDATFMALGMSTVLNALKPDSEATVVKFFKANYDVGTGVDAILNELLERFHIKHLKEKLLDLALEADMNVRPYRNTVSVYLRASTNEGWQKVSSKASDIIQTLCKPFLDDDNQLGPFNATTPSGILELSNKPLMLKRAEAGFAAEGTLGDKQLRINTPHTGQYLQLAVPHEMVEELAYPNTLSPFGKPDPTDGRALSKVKTNEHTIDGQARIIARPDLFWAKGVKQWRYQFSRQAQAKREWYLQSMAFLIQNALTPPLMQRTIALLKPPPIRVLSHNVWYKNQKFYDLAKNLRDYASEYDVACLQECTTSFLDLLAKKLPPSHKLLNAKACGSSQVWAALVYNQTRFEQVGEPWFGCFKLNNGALDDGRPVVTVVLRDLMLGRLMIAASVHSPHGWNYTPPKFDLKPNLEHFVKEALKKAGNVPWSNVSHVFFAGDYNRKDWGDKLSIAEPVHAFAAGKLRLHYAQGGVSGTIGTYTTGKGEKIAIDNVVYGSRATSPHGKVCEPYSLELTSFKELGRRGSDHRSILATFAA